MARTRHRVGMSHDHRTLSHTTPPRSALGTVAWVQQTSGWLTAADRRVMVSRLARIQVRNVVGRVAMATHLHSGRHAYVPWERLAAPTTALTVAAEQRARQLLTAPLLNHSYRSFVFGRALGELDGVDVDTELLFAAAMLHDTGLMGPVGTADFTLKSARVAREVAEEVGLSSAASEILQTAITMHHTPGVELTQVPVPTCCPPAQPSTSSASAPGAAHDSLARPSDLTRATTSRRSSLRPSATRPPACRAAAPGSCTATARSAPPSIRTLRR